MSITIEMLDSALAPICRKPAGSYMPETKWLLYAENAPAPLCRKPGGSYMAEDDTATVLKAATEIAPKRRYTAGKRAGQVRFLRRYLPESFVDKAIRKFNQLPA